MAQHLDGALADLHTCMPGKVRRYNQATQTVDVECAFMRVYKDDPTPVAYPTIVNVPLMQFKAGGAWVKLPVGPGDEVLLCFAERALDVWWSNGGVADPQDHRKFSIADAIAIPGISSEQNALVPLGAIDSLEIQQGGFCIEITNQGQIKMGVPTLGLDVLSALKTFATVSSTATTAPQIAAAAATLLTTLTALVAP